MDRRQILAATGAGLALPVARAAAQPVFDPLAGARLMEDVRAYVDFGVHRAGGAADLKVTDWMTSRFRALGYEIERETFSIPNSDTTAARVQLEGSRVEGFAQPPLAFTPREGLSAPLVAWSDKTPSPSPAGKIALIYQPDIVLGLSPAIRQVVAAAKAAGALAVVWIDGGPTGAEVATNTDPKMQPTIPLLIVGGKHKAALQAAAASGKAVTLTISGPGGMRPAHNTIARTGHEGNWLVISTPQSGWFNCGGERGPGIALELALARWARDQKLPARLLFASNSGHEWQYAGAQVFQASPPPKPEDTALWLHLGASFGARQYNAAAGALTTTDGPNTNRTLMVSPDLLGVTQSAFAGQTPIDKPLLNNIAQSNGEFTHVLEAGYRRSLGFWGSHAHFHAPTDDATKTTPQIMEGLARGLARIITFAVGQTASGSA